MTKYIAALLNGMILIFHWLGYRDQQSIVHWFMTTSRPQLIMHLSVSIGLLLYALFPQIRYRLSQIPLFLMGFTFMATGFVGILSPDLFGIKPDIMLVIDIFFYIESGIILMLAALELPIRHLKKPSENLYYAKEDIPGTPIQAAPNL